MLSELLRSRKEDLALMNAIGEVKFKDVEKLLSPSFFTYLLIYLLSYLFTCLARPLEKRLMKEIGDGKYENIEKLLSPRVLEYCESNILLLSMKVSSSKNYINCKGRGRVR